MKPARHDQEEYALRLGYGTTSRGRRQPPRPPPPPMSNLLYHHPTSSFAAPSKLSPIPPIKTTSSNHHVPRPPGTSSSSFSPERGTIATRRPPVALSTTITGPPPPLRVTMTNPSQMPSVVPSATEPNNQPCILHSTISSGSTGATTTTTTTSSSMPEEEIQRPPPSSCSRYIIQDRGNASPRLLQCTTQTLPQNKYVAEKTGLGRMNMGMLCMPLAVPSQDYDNDICLGDKECSHDDDKRHDIHHGAEYVPLIWDKDTEEYCDQGKGCTKAEVNPIRCKYCKAYWNPFVTLLSEEKSSGTSRRRGLVDYICNFCERTNTVSPLEMQQQQSSEFYTLPLTHGSVEYEVGGEYMCLPRQQNRQQQQAEGDIRDMDMGMDDLIGNERGGREGMTFLFALDGGDWDKFLLYLKVLEYVIEDVKEFWIRQRNLEREILEGVTTDSYKSPRIGFFVHVQDHILIPYWQKKRIVNGGSGTEEDNCWELSVTLMTDVEDEPFSPLPLSMWTFSLLEDCKVMPQTMQQRIHSNEIPLSKLYETLKRIPAILRQMIPDYQCRSSMTTPFSAARGECNAWNCGGAALKILSDALYSCGGGRGTLMTSSLFNHGVGVLYDRQGSTNTKYVNASMEKSLFVPHQKVGSHSESGAFYNRLAEKCVEGGVSLNIMISSPLGPEVDSGIFEKQYLDLATIGEICRHTCGKLRWLKYEDCDFQLEFSIAVEREGCYAHRLKNELLNILCVYTGQGALFKMRCSPGVRIVSFLPKCKVPGEVRNVGFSDSPELILPCVEPDTCIAVELDHRVGGIPKRKNMNDNQTEDAAILYIQTALLYTNPLGRRRVRVSTLALKATDSIPEIYCTANFDTLAAFMVRLAINDLMDSPSQKKASLAMARQEIINRCIQILTSYRKYGDTSTAKQGQLILPETLQLLPLFCLSLLKSRLFRPSLLSNPSTMCKPSPTADERAFHLFHCSNICPSMAMLVVHPCVYDLNNLSPNVGEPVLPESHSSMISSFYNVPSSSYTYDQDPFVFRAANEPYIQLPPLLRPSVSCISDGGLYLIDNGFQIVLYIGRNVSLDDRSTNILSIINSKKDSNYSGLRHLSISSSSPFGRRLWKIISQLRKCYSCSIFSNYSRPWHTPVVVIIGNGGPGFRSGIDSSLEEELIQGLVEDPSNDGMSYEEFLIYIYKKMNAIAM